jgi:hypothetical protein
MAPFYTSETANAIDGTVHYWDESDATGHTPCGFTPAGEGEVV